MSYINKVDDIVRNKKELLIQFFNEIAFDDKFFFEQFSHMLQIQSIKINLKKSHRVLISILLKVLI